MHACSVTSVVSLFVTLWTVAYQSPLSMEFPRQEYWSGLPCPAPGDLPNPGVKPISPASSALQGDSLPLSHQGSPNKPILTHYFYLDFLSLYLVSFFLFQDPSQHYSLCLLWLLWAVTISQTFHVFDDLENFFDLESFAEYFC